MQTIQTAELTGAALDWAVAKCEGVDMIPPERNQTYVYSRAFGNCYAPSRASGSGWNIAGPIIEREEMSIRRYWNESGVWIAESRKGFAKGPTPLIAAMRCYVASKLGDTVEVPDELTGA